MRLSEHNTRRLITALWIVVTATLAATTFFTSSQPYGRWWFFLLWGATALALAYVMVVTSMWRRVGSFILHLSLLIILLGGALTAIWGERGSVTLVPEMPPVYSWVTDEAPFTRPLPMPLSLDSFVVDTHQGIASPRDYISYLNVGKVSVNHPLRIGSYRIYQSSFTPSGATVLGVDYDPAHGREVSYAGYLMLGIGFILIMANKRGRFIAILRSLSVGLLIASPLASQASPRGISEADAAALDTLQVLYNGRIAPFSTPATELMRAMGAETSSPMRIAASIMVYPADWGKVALLKVKSQDLRRALGITDDMIAPDELYLPDGTYRLANLYNGGDKGLDKDILELDAALSAFRDAAEGTLCSPLPASASPLPRWRVVAERIYTGIPIRKIAFMAILTTALMGLMLQAMRRGELIFAVAVVAMILYQGVYLALKWLIAGTIPMATGEDAMSLVAFILLILSLGCLRLRESIMAPLAVLMAGFAALVAYISAPVTDIHPVMPVLSSPWLAIHVGLVMTAYALLTLTFIIALINIFKSSDRLTKLALSVIYPASALLAAGIFTGAVWAGDAWGRYWAWDPKETWALVTLMVYIIPLHRCMNPKTLSIFLTIAFLTVIMTYWGVNYLPSIHAYQ
ncbi:MAG: cytochrome c biogenesis protein CcsA [Pseudoflavonifractor sp.]|nr:cytochrome c biogenesis protein CcsA [Alloprevotella sp.]MCM1116898.1 cytochrome c biogenesis protein CcsA [Pseudoflavonifractor sp.]